MGNHSRLGSLRAIRGNLSSSKVDSAEHRESFGAATDHISESAISLHRQFAVSEDSHLESVENRRGVEQFIEQVDGCFHELESGLRVDGRIGISDLKLRIELLIAFGSTADDI